MPINTIHTRSTYEAYFSILTLAVALTLTLTLPSDDLGLDDYLFASG